MIEDRIELEYGWPYDQLDRWWRRMRCAHVEWEYDEDESKGPWTGYIERCKHCGVLRQVPQ